MKQAFALIFCFTYLALYGQDWTVTTISNDGFKPILAIDREDKVHIVYMSEAIEGWVKYAMIQDGVIVNESTVSTGYFYGPPDITYDQFNNPVIAFHDHDSEDQAVYLRQNNAWIDHSTRDEGHDGWDNSIIVDASGVVHSSSINPFNGPGVEYGRLDVNTWTVEQVGSGPIMYANATSIGRGTMGQVYISYFNDRNGRLELASKIDGVWGIEIVDPGPAVGRFSALLVENDDELVISYYSDAGEIKVAERLGGTWVTEVIDSLQNVEVGFSGARNLTSLAKNGDQYGLAYGDKSIIKLASFSSNLNDLQIETVLVQTDQEFGQIVSLDFNSEGIPYIAFAGSDESNNPLGNVFVTHRSGNSTGVRNSNVKTSLTFPNPVVAGSVLNVQADRRFTDFKLINAHGQSIRNGKLVESKINIPSNLSRGVYYLSLRGSQGPSFHKIIVSH